MRALLFKIRIRIRLFPRIEMTIDFPPYGVLQNPESRSINLHRNRMPPELVGHSFVIR